ncbi:MAG: methylcrotonoyl-CoA carboxylase [Candidatus Latescibacteria bacterium]|nr:methylcrotonoyl-CoA carboxylase [Candidatus Latescibacterota bacterium]NIM21752.1 methylcrotonoyl-CoA carboxylase [Candidatus Latescibacterota bacterium]NIM65890.1 methylcrotonoyl-CoA carboxylase [Candidatus Latescibacterota bacterium]NIO02635.1 methylcrotonoyl-CoA carboxylase [Candidatus Latescibacterota bacterium]NIO29616.1 methylcrotonoyl-CoA carboxylase [Candidatus Latescibacterota bacterium]
MYKIESKVRTSAPEYQQNYAYNKKKIEEFREILARIKQGGPPKAIEKHKARGKLTARERLEKLFDRNTPFLEFSTLSAYGMYDDQAPCAGIITGVGVVHGKEVAVVANDATVKGGTYFPITVRKHVRLQEIALENRLPCVYLVDSGGVFLPLQDGVFPDKDHFGRIFYNQAKLSALGIPQISSVMGSCTAGGAYVPAMSDETIIVKGEGTIFIGGPPLVKAATGVDVTPEDLGGAEVHTRISGVSDHYAHDDEHAIQILRNILESVPAPKKFPLDISEPEDPAYDPEEIYGVLPRDLSVQFDVREVIARIVDGGRFHEFKELYGQTLVTGFARIMGYPVGIVANNGVLFSESAQKGAHFVSLCAVRKIPLVFLQNITGFIVGKEFEHGGIAKDGAKMVHAVANAQVPRFTLVIGASHGAGNYAMCGRGYFPRLLWMWPTSKISVMGGEQASNVLLTVKKAALEMEGKTMTPDEEKELAAPILEKYEREGSAYYATARLWDDGVIEPLDTRRALGLAISMSLNCYIPEHQFGVFRM